MHRREWRNSGRDDGVISGGGTVRRLIRGLFALGALAIGLPLSSPAGAEEVKIGILFGTTGHYANFVPPLLDAVRLAVDEVNANGGILRGQKLQAIVGDTKSTTQGAIDAAARLVNVENVVAIVGPNTSPGTIAVAHAVAVPKHVLLISPTATSTVLTTLEDQDFVFRLAPSDADQGWLLAKLVHEEGITKVALAYIDTVYGASMADTFRFNFENFGGTITSANVYESGKSSYLPELKDLSAYDPDALVLIGFAANGGITIIKEALAHGFFKQFIGTYSLMDPLLIKEVGADNLKNMFFTAPSMEHGTRASLKFDRLYSASYATTKGKLYIAQAYDAAMLTALAIEQAGSTNRAEIRDALREICCAPGEVIEPGEWAKAKAAIADGRRINYEGASGSCDFDENGDVTGVYGHFVIQNGAFKEVGLAKP